jgi:hypothetical protein
MSPLRSYDHPLHKNLVFPRERLSDLSTIFKKMGISKFLWDTFGEKRALGEAICPPIASHFGYGY